MRTIGANVMRSVFVTAVWAGLLMMGSTVSTSHADRNAASPGYRPRGDRRLVMYFDPQAIWFPTLSTMNPASEAWAEDPEAWKAGVEAIVDAHADAGVDTIVHCVFSRFCTN